jgi:hypothetical protein
MVGGCVAASAVDLVDIGGSSLLQKRGYIGAVGNDIDNQPNPGRFWQMAAFT